MIRAFLRFAFLRFESRVSRFVFLGRIAFCILHLSAFRVSGTRFFGVSGAGLRVSRLFPAFRQLRFHFRFESHVSAFRVFKARFDISSFLFHCVSECVSENRFESYVSRFAIQPPKVRSLVPAQSVRLAKACLTLHIWSLIPAHLFRLCPKACTSRLLVFAHLPRLCPDLARHA